MTRRFKDFIEDDSKYLRSEWVMEDTFLEIYVRRCIRWKGTFELANITLPSELQGKGVFKLFMSEWNDKLPMLIECVNNPWFAAYLDRTGWNLYDLNGRYDYYNELAHEAGVYRDPRFQIKWFDV